MRSRIPNKPLPPWYDPNDKELMANLAERTRLSDAMKRESIELFRRNVEKGQVLEMQNATHYIIQSNQQRSAGGHREVCRRASLALRAGAQWPLRLATSHFRKTRCVVH